MVANLNQNDDGADAGEPDVLLAAALDKARKLVADLERQQRELVESPPPPHHATMSPQQLAEGKQAFDNAVASARRMLKALEDAAAIPAHER